MYMHIFQNFRISSKGELKHNFFMLLSLSLYLFILFLNQRNIYYLVVQRVSRVAI